MASTPEAGGPALTPDEQQLWRTLGRVIQRLPRVVDDAMTRASGLTMSEFSVLDTLREAPERTLRINEIATNTGLSSSRVSRVVAALAKQGWCLRERDASDGRGALAVLTDEGAAKAEAASVHHVRLAREHVLRHVPESARATLIETLHAISSAR